MRYERCDDENNIYIYIYNINLLITEKSEHTS